MELRGIDFGSPCLQLPVANDGNLPDVGSVGRPFFYAVSTAPAQGGLTPKRWLDVEHFTNMVSAQTHLDVGISIKCIHLLSGCNVDEFIYRVSAVCAAMYAVEDYPLMLQVTYDQLLMLDAARLLDDDAGYDAVCVTGGVDYVLAHELITLKRRYAKNGLRLGKPIVTDVSHPLFREELQEAGIGCIETYAG